MARPTDYNPEIAETLCDLLSDGISLRAICRRDEMPAKATVFKWLGVHPEFVDQYTRALEARADSLTDDILDIADNEALDVNRSRLMVDTRKWIASKLKPKKYGDKVEQTLKGDPDAPVAMSITSVDAQL